MEVLNMRSFRHTRTFIVGGVLLSEACKQLEAVADEGREGGSIPPLVQMAFDENCVKEACHDASGPQAGLALTAGDSLAILDRRSTQNPDLPLVELGNVYGSYLAIKLLPDDVLMERNLERRLERMPPAGQMRDEESIALILGWIAGAELPGGDDGSTGASETDAGGSGSETAGSGSETGGGLKDCSLMGVAPGVTSPLVSGTMAMQLPIGIGEIIERNCGCHLVMDEADLLEGFEPVPPGGADLTTLAGIRADLGTIESYVMLKIMPRYPDCGQAAAGDDYMTMEDYDTLLAWLDAGAPDAVDWGM